MVGNIRTSKAQATVFSNYMSAWLYNGIVRLLNKPVLF